MAIELKEAKETDVILLFDLITSYWEETPLSINTELQMSAVLSALLTAVKDLNEVVILAIEEGEVVGIIWGALEVEIWSGELHARERVFYVMPHKRGGILGARLIKDFCKWADARGANTVHFAAASGVGENEPAKRLYQAMGMTLVGYTFIKK